MAQCNNCALYFICHLRQIMEDTEIVKCKKFISKDLDVRSGKEAIEKEYGKTVKSAVALKNAYKDLTENASKYDKLDSGAKAVCDQFVDSYETTEKQLQEKLTSLTNADYILDRFGKLIEPDSNESHNIQPL